MQEALLGFSMGWKRLGLFAFSPSATEGVQRRLPEQPPLHEKGDRER